VIWTGFLFTIGAFLAVVAIQLLSLIGFGLVVLIARYGGWILWLWLVLFLASSLPDTPLVRLLGMGVVAIVAIPVVLWVFAPIFRERKQPSPAEYANPADSRAAWGDRQAIADQQHAKIIMTLEEFLTRPPEN
jgi:hypothetical protein